MQCSDCCSSSLVEGTGRALVRAVVVEAVVRFWNNLASLARSSVPYQIAVHNCTLAISEGLRYWALGVISRALRIGFTIPSDWLDLIDQSVGRTCLMRREDDEAWTGLHLCPGLCPSSEAQWGIQFRSSAKPPTTPVSFRLLAPTWRIPRTELLALPLWCRDLPTVQCGWPLHRCCPFGELWPCRLEDIGDERQLGFLCSAVQHVRDVDSCCPTMRQFMWQDGMVTIRRFVAGSLDNLQNAIPALYQP
jgi:hypothetical protein